MVLISGRTGLQPPTNVDVINVITAQEMHDAVIGCLDRCDILIAVAAVADYRVTQRHEHKLKKTGAGLKLELEPNPDILESVALRENAPFCVGFSAESENVESHAAEKRRRKKIPLIAANLVQDAFGSAHNELILIDDDGAHHVPRSSKLHQARALIRHVTRLYKPVRKSVTVR